MHCLALLSTSIINSLMHSLYSSRDNTSGGSALARVAAINNPLPRNHMHPFLHVPPVHIIGASVSEPPTCGLNGPMIEVESKARQCIQCRLSRWMDGWMDGRMDGLVDKWTVTSTYLSIVTARPLSPQVGPGSLTLAPN